MIDLTKTKAPNVIELAEATRKLARRLDLMGWGDAIVGINAYSYGGGAIRVAVHVRTFAETNAIATYLGARTAHTAGSTFIYDWAKVVGSPFWVQVYGPADTPCCRLCGEPGGDCAYVCC